MGYVLFKSHLTDEQNALRMVEWRYAEKTGFQLAAYGALGDKKQE